MGILNILTCISVTLCMCCPKFVDAATMEETKALHNMVLDGYNVNILPIRNQSEEFRVRVVISLLALSDLDETEERLTTVMFLDLFWRDESIVWNRTEYDVRSITVDAAIVWRPHIAVTNAHASSKIRNNQDWELVEYKDYGFAHWSTMRTFETSCEIDTTYYPFDVQRCSVEIFIYGYYGKIDFRPIFFGDHLDRFEPQGTWNVTDYYISNEKGSNVTVTYHLERNPRYMVINFLVPLLVLALLNPIVFLLPAGSGERIGYSITIMLALSVYMTLLGEYLPKNSDPIPIMTYTIMVLYIIVAASLCFLFLSARIYNTPKSKPVPDVLKKFVVFVRKIFCEDCHCRRKCRTAAEEDEEAEMVTTGCLEDANNGDTRIRKPTKNAEEKHDDIAEMRKDVTTKSNISWHSVSKSMDVIFMIFIYLVKILFVLIILHKLSQRQKLERIIAKTEE